jgi:hypothetical protein
MNTSTDEHLDLEELLAGAAGRPLSEQARDHLASCPDCRSERAAWSAATGGVRQLTAATELPPWRFPAAPGHRPRRRVLLTAAASVAVLAAVGGTTWGLTSGSTPAGTMAGLTAVTGCPGLAAVSGTLAQVDGTQLTVRDLDGATVTVATSGSTRVQAEQTGSLGDVTDGTRVIVHGTPGTNVLAAENILANTAKPPQPSRLRTKLPQPPTASPRPGTVVGTVSDVHAGGFTVTQQLAGFQVQVTTSAATVVNTLVASSTRQLQTGERVIAVGPSGPNGSLTALSVEQGTSLPMVQTVPSRSAAGSCDPTAVASALALGT